MNRTETDTILDILQRGGIQFNRGLAEGAFSDIEAAIGVQFPEDLKALLKVAVPIGEYEGASFPDWNKNPLKIFSSSQEFIEEAFKFDIENNNFWIEIFGEKPKDLTLATHQAMEVIRRAPRLIPIFGHRFISSVPASPDNPVISFLQPDDVVVYGSNLREYFEIEFEKKELDRIRLSDLKHVPFWSEFIE